MKIKLQGAKGTLELADESFGVRAGRLLRREEADEQGRKQCGHGNSFVVKVEGRR